MSLRATGAVSASSSSPPRSPTSTEAQPSQNRESTPTAEVKEPRRMMDLTMQWMPVTAEGYAHHPYESPKAKRVDDKLATSVVHKNLQKSITRPEEGTELPNPEDPLLVAHPAVLSSMAAREGSNSSHPSQWTSTTSSVYKPLFP